MTTGVDKFHKTSIMLDAIRQSSMLHLLHVKNRNFRPTIIISLIYLILDQAAIHSNDLH